MSQTTLLDLSRWQWAITAAMHITFPAVTVGTSVLLIVCYGMYMRTNSQTWLQMFRFWRRIFGIGFALGVVSGIVMTFEFGLNWGPFAHDVGPILGVIIAMEVLTAFFLEAGFLGLLVYGEGRISQRAMMFSTCMVSLGTILSVTWILVANSWMQTPAGYKTVNGQFQPEDWIRVIFNPSFGIRVLHMLVGSLVAAGFFIAGISAWYLLKHRHVPIARRGLSLSIGALALLVPVQMWLGDTVADYIGHYQLPKLEAIEGNWNSTNTGENLFIIPDQNAAKNTLQITLPCYGSAVAKDWSCNTPTPGLDLTPKALRPSVWAAFYGFRVMWYGAMLMLAATFIGIILRLRGRLYNARWFHRILVIFVPIGILAIWGGWVVAEAGRQPWIVYGKLLTAQAVSPLNTVSVLITLMAFIAVYLSLVGTYVWYVARVVRQGPDETLDLTDRGPSISSYALPNVAPAGR
jgi:cytochrome bd ubiquinol oxidase subunit I